MISDEKLRMRIDDAAKELHGEEWFEYFWMNTMHIAETIFSVYEYAMALDNVKEKMAFASFRLLFGDDN